MTKRHSKVTLITSMDEILKESTPQPMVMVRPLHARKYGIRNLPMAVEVVDLNTLNLAKVKAFETL